MSTIAPARPSRRTLLAAMAGAALSPLCGTARAGARAESFAQYLAGLWPAAAARGVRREVFDAALGGLTPDPALAGVHARQPEFIRPVGFYVRERVTPARIARGRAESARWTGPLARAGVPASILVAIWGMESDYGRLAGTKDVVRSLASLAYAQPERPVFADELVAALLILQSGEVPRDRLVGSWAGAMGQPQFMPSTYLEHAVRLEGGGRGDIWGSAADTLGSIARLLRDEGWRPGLPWGAQVRIPPGFDYAAHRQDIASWRAAGIAPEGGGWPGDAVAILYFPAGARGPAFLISDNFFVIKAYNTSDSYALSVGVLADAAAGKANPPAWPAGDAALSRSQQAALQRGLAALGYYDGVMDGKIGPAMRAAIHAFQRATGLQPADAHPSQPVLQAVLAAAGTRAGPGD